MTIADDFYRDTGQRVGQAVYDMHQEGRTIEQAAKLIGYSSSTDLRRYLDRRQLVCPWPLTALAEGDKRRQHRISDDTLTRYAGHRLAGLSATEAARKVGGHAKTLSDAIVRRMPDLARALERNHPDAIAIGGFVEWRDADGTTHRRQRTFWQVPHPLNTGPDGLPKTRQTIMHELIGALAQWYAAQEVTK